MTKQILAIAMGAIAIMLPGPATAQSVPMGSAPPAGPDAHYCMRVEATTGSRIEKVECWTRAEWADEGVDVDRDWTREGVAVLA